MKVQEHGIEIIATGWGQWFGKPDWYPPAAQLGVSFFFLAICRSVVYILVHVRSWEDYVTFLCLGFLICKVGEVTVRIS